MRKIAIVLGTRLGDSVIELILSELCVNNGVQATLFSDPLIHLSVLVPNLQIEAMSSCTQETLGFFDEVVYPHQSPEDFPPIEKERGLYFRMHSLFAEPIPLHQTYRKLCRELFSFEDVQGSVRLAIPEDWGAAGEGGEVLIHPTAH